MMKISYVLLGLVACTSATGLWVCWETTKSALDVIDPDDQESITKFSQEWRNNCADLLPHNVGAPNKDLNVQLQTELVLADAALVYYSYYQVYTLQLYALTKLVRDIYDWVVLVDIMQPNKGMECFTLSLIHI